MMILPSDFVPFFAENAHNVYRTEHFIVRQQLKVQVSADGVSTLVSVDTFFPRCFFTDSLYDSYYSKRENIDGKRMPCQKQIRTYSH